MKKDIENMDELKFVMNAFFQLLKTDPILAHYFSHLTPDLVSQYILKLAQFFHNVIFNSGVYLGNPMEIHTNIHNRKKLTKEDFQQWLLLLQNAITLHFEGANCQKLLNKADEISKILQIKIMKPNI